MNGLNSYNEIYLRRYQSRFVIEPDPVLRIWEEIQQESDKQLSLKREKKNAGEESRNIGKDVVMAMARFLEESKCSNKKEQYS